MPAILIYALRSLRQSPVFTAVALVTLALGIGVNTAMFSLLDALHNFILLRQTLTSFAALGLLLAALGLYGVIANLVAQRTGEFGIRLALGATPANVLRLVLGQGLRLTLVGLVLGTAGAYALGRLLGALMPRLAGPDAGALATMGGLLLAVALFASWIPARRATKVNPMTALRAE